METKICPLLTIASATCGEGQKLCQGEQCAWWCKNNNMCSLTVMGTYFQDIPEQINNMYLAT